jgi:hypothetical protein
LSGKRGSDLLLSISASLVARAISKAIPSLFSISYAQPLILKPGPDYALSRRLRRCELEELKRKKAAGCNPLKGQLAAEERRTIARSTRFAF